MATRRRIGARVGPLAVLGRDLVHRTTALIKSTNDLEPECRISFLRFFGAMSMRRPNRLHRMPGTHARARLSTQEAPWACVSVGATLQRAGPAGTHGSEINRLQAWTLSSASTSSTDGSSHVTIVEKRRVPSPWLFQNLGLSRIAQPPQCLPRWRESKQRADHDLCGW
jgi:hypothetical protein